MSFRSAVTSVHNAVFAGDLKALAAFPVNLVPKVQREGLGRDFFFFFFSLFGSFFMACLTSCVAVSRAMTSIKQRFNVGRRTL
jgi:hypothetical protein